MSFSTFEKLCERIRDNCISNSVNVTSIVLHGGEPLLIGLQGLKEYCSIIERIIHSKGISTHLGIQSNGLLFNDEIGDFLKSKNMTIGISSDGTIEHTNRHRVDFKGNGIGQDLEKVLIKLSSKQYQSIFSGVLVVIDIENDPLDVFNYFKGINVNRFDVLLPLNNYENLPKGIEKDLTQTPYGDWLIKLFDAWYFSKDKVRIRFFESIIRSILGKKSMVESIGHSPVSLLVIETDGSIELVDSLKSTYDGATFTGFNIENVDFDFVSELKDIKQRIEVDSQIPDKCRACSVLLFCGGGYLPHRFSKEGNFNNPSVYCNDLYKLINHIYIVVAEQIKLSAATKQAPSLNERV